MSWSPNTTLNSIEGERNSLPKYRTFANKSRTMEQRGISVSKNTAGKRIGSAKEKFVEDAAADSRHSYPLTVTYPLQVLDSRTLFSKHTLPFRTLDALHRWKVSGRDKSSASEFEFQFSREWKLGTGGPRGAHVLLYYALWISMRNVRKR